MLQLHRRSLTVCPWKVTFPQDKRSPFKHPFLMGYVKRWGCKCSLLKCYSFYHPKDPDPSKLAILRTLPLLYRFKPFHCRVQGSLGQIFIGWLFEARVAEKTCVICSVLQRQGGYTCFKRILWDITVWWFRISLLGLCIQLGLRYHIKWDITLAIPEFYKISIGTS